MITKNGGRYYKIFIKYQDNPQDIANAFPRVMINTGKAL
jgi:hypothetical protein